MYNNLVTNIKYQLYIFSLIVISKYINIINSNMPKGINTTYIKFPRKPHSWVPLN